MTTIGSSKSQRWQNSHNFDWLSERQLADGYKQIAVYRAHRPEMPVAPEPAATRFVHQFL